MYLADQARLGWRWYRESLLSVRNEPVYFTATVVFYAFAMLLLGMLPAVGPLLAGLFWPFGSVMVAKAGSDSLARRKPSITPVFEAMRRRATRLRMMRIGILYSIVAVTVGAAWAYLAEAEIALWEVRDGRIVWESAASHVPWVAIWTALAVYIPGMMALWFSPLLVDRKNMTLGKAFFFSFMGCLRNLPSVALSLLLALGTFLAAAALAAAALGAAGLEDLEMYLLLPVSLLGTALVYGTYYPMWHSVFSDVPEDSP